MSKTINLNDLDVDQLMSFKKETEQEVQNFSYSATALNTAVAKFKSNLLNIDEISSKGKQESEILVPLTSSLYVPGKIADNKKFLCDIGTGYFVEKNAADSKDFYQKKINKLTQDSVKLNQIIKTKSDLLQSLDNVLQKKLIQAQSQLPSK